MIVNFIVAAFQTTLLNKHLSELMPGLTAKVFRTFNASKTLQDQLEDLTEGINAYTDTHTHSHTQTTSAKCGVLCNVQYV